MNQLSDTQGRTALSRKGPSAPLKWLINNFYIRQVYGKRQHLVDYGCGKGEDVHYIGQKFKSIESRGFDPVHRPVTLLGYYDIILCTYVLNVVTEEVQKEILASIKTLCKDSTDIFISVRRDLPKEGKQGRGCWQRYVECPEGFETIVENKSFAIFKNKRN